MCLLLRKTVSLGRSFVPTMLRRTCSRRRSCRFFLSFCWSMLLSVNHIGRWALHPLSAACEGLAFLATNLFILVPHALALVRFGLARRTNFGGKLANLLL